MPSKNGKKSRKNGKRAEAESRFPAALDMNPETIRGLFTLLILVLAILFTLAAFGLAGSLGNAMNGFSRDLLGLLYPLLPLFLFFQFLARVTGKKLGLDGAVRLGVLLFIVMLATMIHLVITRNVGLVFNKMLWEGGGYIGM